MPNYIDTMRNPLFRKIEEQNLGLERLLNIKMENIDRNNIATFHEIGQGNTAEEIIRGSKERGGASIGYTRHLPPETTYLIILSLYDQLKKAGYDMTQLPPPGQGYKIHFCENNEAIYRKGQVPISIIEKNKEPINPSIYGYYPAAEQIPIAEKFREFCNSKTTTMLLPVSQCSVQFPEQNHLLLMRFEKNGNFINVEVTDSVGRDHIETQAQLNEAMSSRYMAIIDTMLKDTGYSIESQIYRQAQIVPFSQHIVM